MTQDQEQSAESLSLSGIITKCLGNDRDPKLVASRVIAMASKIREPEDVPEIGLSKGDRVHERGAVVSAMSNHEKLRVLFGDPDGREAIVIAIVNHYVPESNRVRGLPARRAAVWEWFNRLFPFADYGTSVRSAKSAARLVRK